MASCSTPEDAVIPTPPIPTPPVVVEWTQIPDNKFETGLIELGFDDVIDGKVLTNNIANIVTLRLEHKRIQNISGIEAFKNLEFLFLWDNDFTEINVRNLKKLKILGLSECPLNTVDLSQNTELVEIDFQNASQRATDPTYAYGKTKGFVTLDLKYNTKLERIYIWTNRIKELDVSMCPNLTDLWIGGSGSGTGSGNPIEKLDLSNNPILNTIVLDNCNLNYLNIKNTASGGVPRICTTFANPNLLEIKVSSLVRINAYRSTLNSEGIPMSEVSYKKDAHTNYVE
jgi:Leucine-rich repeat (LRR) protein